MPDNAALVPVPFPAPVRSRAGMLPYRRGGTRRTLGSHLPPRIVVSDPVDGLAYDRRGRMIRDWWLGIWVDLYA